MKRYFAIKTVISLCTGIAAGLWCYVVGVDFALLWGFLAFLLNYIPSIGSILAAIPAVALSFVQLTPGATLAVAAGYAVINVVMGNLARMRSHQLLTGKSPRPPTWGDRNRVSCTLGSV